MKREGEWNEEGGGMKWREWGDEMRHDKKKILILFEEKTKFSIKMYDIKELVQLVTTQAHN